MILVTGGAGFIGSHTLVELLDQGYDVAVLDDLSNSDELSLSRVKEITGKSFLFYKGSIGNCDLLKEIFSKHPITTVIHFAGFKAVEESIGDPLNYYANNFSNTVTLCQVMNEFKVKSMIFSSSANIYGEPATVPVCEHFPIGGTTNPYGTSKYMIERLLMDLCASDPDWSVTSLRYFNPVGAHPSGLIGESANGAPSNLVPYIAKVALGKLEHLNIYGNDYDTPDGTGVRDYIHVVDLAQGHLAALHYLTKGYDAINLGTGEGVSVFDALRAFELASGSTIPYKIVARRTGDIAQSYADVSYARKRLGWRANLSLADMMRDTWRWQSQNPDGFR